MSSIKIFLVNLWISIYRLILFPLIVSKSEPENIINDYFKPIKNPKKISILIVSKDEKWIGFWINALKKFHTVDSLRVVVEENLKHGLRDRINKSKKYDLVLWYLSANYYRPASLNLVRKLSKCIARINWDDEFNFFLPKPSSPLSDAKLFDCLLSSSALAVASYRSLGYNSELLFNGIMFKSDVRRINKNKELGFTKVVFIGSFTYTRQNFFSMLSKHINGNISRSEFKIRIDIYGIGWPETNGLNIMGKFNSYVDLVEYDAIINLNYLSLSDRFTHTKFRDFEFLGLGIPVILHKSLENQYISENLLYFESIDDLIDILTAKNKGSYCLPFDEISSLESYFLLSKTFNLINKNSKGKVW